MMTPTEQCTTQWFALLLGATLLVASGCGDGKSTTSPDPVPGDLPEMSAEFPWRVNTLTIPEWYTSLAIQPVVDIEGEVASWSWKFGDGAVPAISTEPQPTITLQAPGDYTAILTITDSVGHTGRIAFTYRVLPPTLPIIASIAPEGEVGREFTQSTFSATIFGPPVTSLNWDFGDGALPAQSTDVSPQVELQRIGSHTGTLEVCGPFGCTEKEFGYAVRAPQAVWEEFPMPGLPSLLQVLMAPDGTGRLLYLEGNDLKMALLPAAASPDQGTVEHIFLRSFSPENPGEQLNAFAGPDALYVLLGFRYWPSPEPAPVLFRISYDGTEVSSILLNSIEGLTLNYGGPYGGLRLGTGQTHFYLLTGTLVAGNYVPTLLPIAMGNLSLGVPHLLAPPASADVDDYSLSAFDLQEIDGVLYRAEIREGGAPIVHARTLTVGRLTGTLDQGATAWTMVDLDDRARDSYLVRWVPTKSGLQLFYEMNERRNGHDPRIRQAWTADRNFSDSSTWQTSLWSAASSHHLMPVPFGDGPLVLSSSTSNLSSPTVQLHLGHGNIAGEIPWSEDSLEIGTIGLKQVSVAGDASGVWVASIDYRKIEGSNGHEVSYWWLADPRLLIGRITFE